MNSTEAEMLVYTTLFTGCLWVPVIVNRIREQGLWTALRHPQAEVPATTDWGKRAGRAHMNAIENLVIFAPLVLLILATDKQSELTATLVVVFFTLRVAHYVVYLMAVPLVRTLLFAGGWAVQLALGAAVLL